MDLGPGQREDEQRAVLQLAQGQIEELDGGAIAPVQVLQHEHHGVAAISARRKLEERRAAAARS